MEPRTRSTGERILVARGLEQREADKPDDQQPA
jgi:hypothetical protein